MTLAAMTAAASQLDNAAPDDVEITDSSAAAEYIADGCLVDGPLGRVGLEMEAHCFDPADPFRRPSWEEITEVLEWLSPLPGGSVVSVEPPLRNRQPAARCPPKAPGCTSSWHVCNRNPLRWLPAERYSKDDRDTPTRSATAVRRHNFTAAIAAAGKAAQALPGRSVGGDRGRNCFHRRSHLLLWRVGSRAGEMPLPPLLPPRHVPPRRSRCPRSRDGMGVRVPRRTPSPRHGPRFPWRPGWPGCWSDWSGSHHRAGAPLAAGRTSPFS